MALKNNQKTLSSNNVLISSLVASLVAFALFFVTMPSQNVGYADSDLLMAIAYNRGVSPPPGIPLYTVLLSIFLHLPLPLSIAMKGHVLSAVFGAATIGIIYASALILHRLTVSIPKQKSGSFNPSLLAWVTAGSLAVAHPFWLYSVVAEKYSFSAFLVALLALLTLLSFDTKKGKTAIFRILGLTTFVFGVAVSHQPLLTLLAPMLVFAWHKRMSDLSQQKLILGIAPFFLAILGSFLILLMLNRSGAPVSWNFTATLEGLFNYLKTADFLGYYRTPNAPYFTPVDINQGFSGLINYTKLLFTYFGWWQLPFLYFVYKFIANKSSGLIQALLIGFAGLGLFLPFYTRWPSDWGMQAFILPHYIPGFVLVPLILWFGWYEFSARVSRSFEILKMPPKFIPMVISALLIGFVILEGIFALPQTDLSGFNTVSKRYRGMLTQFADNALVSCFSPTSCNAFLFEQAVRGVRRDIIIFPETPALVQKTLNQPDIKGFDYPTNPYLTWDVLTWNLGKRPVYAVEINKDYFDFLGIEYGFMYFIPYGEYGELSRSLPEELPEVNYPLTAEWMATKTRWWDPMQLELKSTPARDHLLNASVYLKMDRREKAKEETTMAANLFYQFRDQEKKQITGLIQQLEQQSPQRAFAPGSTVPSSQELLGFIPKLIEGNYYTRAYITAKGAVTVNPRDPEAHSALAQIYLKMGNPELAKQEFENALKLDPSRQEALESLQTLP